MDRRKARRRFESRSLDDRHRHRGQTRRHRQGPGQRRNGYAGITGRDNPAPNQHDAKNSSMVHNWLKDTQLSTFRFNVKNQPAEEVTRGSPKAQFLPSWATHGMRISDNFVSALSSEARKRARGTAFSEDTIILPSPRTAVIHKRRRTSPDRQDHAFEKRSRHRTREEKYDTEKETRTKLSSLRKRSDKREGEEMEPRYEFPRTTQTQAMGNFRSNLVCRSRLTVN